jgi:hypothetical protein
MYVKPNLVTLNMLSRLALTDPRSKLIRELEPIAYLVGSRGKLQPLFDAEMAYNISGRKEKKD